MTELRLRSRPLLAAAGLAILALLVGAGLSQRGAPGAGASPPVSATPVARSTTCRPAPDPQLYDPARPPADLLRLADKHTASMRGFVPEDLVVLPEAYSTAGTQRLRSEAAAAVRTMVDGAATEGLTLRVRSGFRSCAEQALIFRNAVRRDGLREAERASARPGHSEHQLGLVADISGPSVGFDLVEEFGNTAEGRWLAANSHRFGFVLSYPQGEEAATGYIYEPWHFRYIGRIHAALYTEDRSATGITLNRWLFERDRTWTMAPELTSDGVEGWAFAFQSRPEGSTANATELSVLPLAGGPVSLGVERYLGEEVRAERVILQLFGRPPGGSAPPRVTLYLRCVNRHGGSWVRVAFHDVLPVFAAQQIETPLRPRTCASGRFSGQRIELSSPLGAAGWQSAYLTLLELRDGERVVARTDFARSSGGPEGAAPH